MSAGGDPVLIEIEIQLRLALQALTNVTQFVARIQAASDHAAPADADADGDAPMASYDTEVPLTSHGGRNGTD